MINMCLNNKTLNLTLLAHLGLYACGTAQQKPSDYPQAIPADDWHEQLSFLTTGKRWADTELTFRLVQDVESEAIRRALARWQSATPFTFTEVTEGPADITIDWASNPFGNYALANTAAFSDANNFYVRATIKFNSDWTWGNPPDENSFDVESVAVHEIGHALGLGHSDQPYTKSPMLRSFVGGEVRRDLSVDDLRGFQSIYGVQESDQIQSGDHLSLITREGSCLNSDLTPGSVEAAWSCLPVWGLSNAIVAVIKAEGGPLQSGDAVSIKTKTGSCWSAQQGLRLSETCGEELGVSDELLRIFTPEGGPLVSGSRVFFQTRSGQYLGADLNTGALYLKDESDVAPETSDQLFEAVKFK